MGDGETRLGAFNRVKNLGLLQPTADLVVAIEGGCEDVPDVHGQMRMNGFAWVVARDNHGQWGEARSASFPIAEIVARRVRQGEELAQVNDDVFREMNSKHGLGATGILTHGAVNRDALYVMPVVFALIPMRNPDLYRGA